MDISAIIYAAVGGGVGGAIGAFLPSVFGKIGKNQTLRSIVGVIFVICGWRGTVALYKNMTLPRIVPMSAAQMDGDGILFSSIRQADPELWAELVKPIDRMTRNNQVTPEGLNAFREKLTTAMIAKRKTASIEALRFENVVGAELFQILKEKSPEVCTQKFYGRPYGDLSTILDSKINSKKILQCPTFLQAAIDLQLMLAIKIKVRKKSSH